MTNPISSTTETEQSIAIIGSIKATTVLYNGAVIQRQGATVWYKLNPVENRWEAISNFQEIEANYQRELRRDSNK